MKEDFFIKGLMILELFNFCFYYFKFILEVWDIFVDFMLKFDFCYELFFSLLINYILVCILRFFWFLRIEVFNEVFVKWLIKILRNIIELFF